MSAKPMTTRRTGTKAWSSWSSVAFIVESIMLMMFLAASLAILTQVFSSSLNHSIESRSRDAATIAAASIAEHFAADPSDIQERTRLGDLLITCDVTDEHRTAGIMHHAVITVYDMSSSNINTPVYTLKTSRYESEVS